MQKVVIVDLETKTPRGINYNKPVDRDDRQWFDGGLRKFTNLPDCLPIHPSNDRKMTKWGYRNPLVIKNIEVFKKSKNEKRILKDKRNNHNDLIRKKGKDPKKVMNHDNTYLIDQIVALYKPNQKHPRGIFRNLSDFIMT